MGRGIALLFAIFEQDRCILDLLGLLLEIIEKLIVDSIAKILLPLFYSIEWASISIDCLHSLENWISDFWIFLVTMPSDNQEGEELKAIPGNNIKIQSSANYGFEWELI